MSNQGKEGGKGNRHAMIESSGSGGGGGGGTKGPLMLTNISEADRELLSRAKKYNDGDEEDSESDLSSSSDEGDDSVRVKGDIYFTTTPTVFFKLST